MPYTFDTKLNPAEYDDFVKQHPAGNLLQSAGWAKVKSNWQHLLLGLRDENAKLVAAALVLIRPLKLGWSFWYIPRGPILNYHDREVLTVFCEELKSLMHKEKCAFLKLDPPFIAHKAPYEEFEDRTDQDALALKEFLESLGFKHQGFVKEMKLSIQPRYEAITYAGDKALRERISRRSRKALKESRKNMVEVYRGGEADLADFCYLIEKTEAAKNISLRDKDYYRLLMDVYGDDCYLYLAAIKLPQAIKGIDRQIAEVEAKLAALPENAPKKTREYNNQLRSFHKSRDLFSEMQEKEGEKALLAGCLSILYGNNFEMLYAGFNRDYGFIPAQDPVYIASMERAFADGASYAGMGGVEGDLQDGLMEYKAHFDPEVVAWLGEFDLVQNQLIYLAYKAYIKMR